MSQKNLNRVNKEIANLNHAIKFNVSLSGKERANKRRTLESKRRYRNKVLKQIENNPFANLNTNVLGNRSLPPLPPKPAAALVKVAAENANKSKLVNTAHVATGIPKNQLNNMSKEDLVKANTRIAMGYPVHMERRVGPFGGVYNYRPNKNIRARTGLAFKMLGRKFRNIPKRVSKSYHSGMSGFYAGRAEAARKAANLANIRLRENAARRATKNQGKWWSRMF